MNIDYQLIGKRIKNYRKSSKRTQEDLAEYLSVSVGYISQIERGVTKINLETLSKIAAFLYCDITELINSSTTNQSNYLNGEFLHMFNQLNNKQKNIVIDLMESLLKNV